MDCKLVIPKNVHNKYHYFLTKFKELEWSGPAWYEIKTDKDGFPTEWKILHFHPLNLGGHAATEWEAKDLAKILGETYRKFPKLKKAFIGLIHSHNTMGAFLSGTDTNTLEEMAPDKNFYGSLVVASSGKELAAFGFSWKDQYKCVHTHILEEVDIEITNGYNVNPEWITIADKIEKEKPVPKPGQQMSVLSNNSKGWKQKGITPKAYQEVITINRIRVIDKYPNDVQTKMNTLLNKLDTEDITEEEFENKALSLGMSLTDVISLQECNVEYGYGGYNGFYY